MQFPKLLFSRPNEIKRKRGKRREGNARDTRFLCSIRQLGNEVQQLFNWICLAVVPVHTNITLSSPWRREPGRSSLRVVLNIPGWEKKTSEWPLCFWTARIKRNASQHSPFQSGGASEVRRVQSQYTRTVPTATGAALRQLYKHWQLHFTHSLQAHLWKYLYFYRCTVQLPLLINTLILSLYINITANVWSFLCEKRTI